MATLDPDAVKESRQCGFGVARLAKDASGQSGKLSLAIFVIG